MRGSIVRDGRDTIRQVIVALSAVVAIIGAFIGTGAAGGTPIQDAAGGALSARATLVAPAGPAFSIWTVIYLGLLAYAVWQFFPRVASSARHRRLGYPIALSLGLNAAWLLSIQFDALWLSVPIIVALLIVLILAFRMCLALRPEGMVDTIITDGTIGLYLGWVSLATIANVAAVLNASGFDGFGIPEDLWAVVMIAVAGAIGVWVAIRSRGRIAPALSLSWGLAWLAVARLTGAPESVAAGVAAIIAVVAVLAFTAVIRIESQREATAFGGPSAAASRM